MPPLAAVPEDVEEDGQSWSRLDAEANDAQAEDAVSAPACDPAAEVARGSEVEDDGSSSGEEEGGGQPAEQAVKRNAADQALLDGTARRQAGFAPQAAACSSQNAKDVEDTKSDEGSSSDGECDVTAARFDRDIDLIHQQHQRHAGLAPDAQSSQQRGLLANAGVNDVQLSFDEEAATGGADAGDGGAIEDDEAFARRLQMEEQEAVSADAEYARRLQAECDAEAQQGRALLTSLQQRPELQEAPRRPQPEADNLDVQGLAVDGSSHGASSEEIGGADLHLTGLALPRDANLLDTSVDIGGVDWDSLLAKLRRGVPCTKVARNGTGSRRTIAIVDDQLKISGRRLKDVPLASVAGIYLGDNSPDFKASRKPRSFNPCVPFCYGGRRRPTGPNVCCVLATPDRSISLFFGNAAARDEFVQTLAYCVQRARAFQDA